MTIDRQLWNGAPQAILEPPGPGMRLARLYGPARLRELSDTSLATDQPFSVLQGMCGIVQERAGVRHPHGLHPDPMMSLAAAAGATLRILVVVALSWISA